MDKATTLQLTASEVRAVHRWRQIGHGRMSLSIVNGEPAEWDIQLHERADKPVWPGAGELVRELSQPAH